MKKCKKCGTENVDIASFCSLCSEDLSKTTININNPKLQKLLQKKQAEIMFVLDCTGRMQGEIDTIKTTITDFADTIEKDNVRVKVGLIEFRDRLINEEHRVLKFNGEIFTNNPEIFRKEVEKIKADGGGDIPESSLDAIMLALNQPFTPEVTKVIVLITDAPPHIPDQETKNIEEVIKKLAEKNIDQIHLVIRNEEEDSKVYRQLIGEAKGLCFELGKGEDFKSRSEHFKKVLMQLGKTISAMTV
ncbi:MAG TPA: VWA domain-containing protein [Allocoleopsis sp.]